jgi:hypothetical protein
VRFGFNDQVGHLTQHGKVAPWVDCLRVPIPVSEPASVLDQYMYVAGGADTVIACLYDTNPNPDINYWTNLAVAIRQRHPTAIIEVGNEPNLDVHGPVPAEKAREIMEVVNYLLGGYACIGPAMAPIPGWQTYFRTVYANRWVQPSLHIYPNATDWAAQADAWINLCWEYTNGGPWHVTEFGMGREPYPGEADNASKNLLLYKKIAAKGAATGVHHSLTRLVQSPGDWEDRMKLWAVKTDGTLSAIGQKYKTERT